MESEQIQQEPPSEPDFARIAQEAPEPSLAERLGGPALAWGGGLAAIALVALGALWLRDERTVNQAMEVVAVSARGDTKAQTPAKPPAAAAPALSASGNTPEQAPAGPPALAAPTASTLPPLVMLPSEQAVKPAAAGAAAARPEVPARVAITPQAAAPARPGVPAKAATTARPAAALQAKARTAPPRLAAKAQRPAVKPMRAESRIAARAARGAAPAVVVNERPGEGDKLNMAVARRCKTGDLARECLASLCREGKKGDAACQALSNLDH